MAQLLHLIRMLVPPAGMALAGWLVVSGCGKRSGVVDGGAHEGGARPPSAAVRCALAPNRWVTAHTIRWWNGGRKGQPRGRA